MRILITGFEPSWGIKKTPSGELAKLWADGSLKVDGVDVRALVLPQLFGKAAEIVVGEIGSFCPDAVVMYGATQKNEPVRLEKFALNVEKSPMGDNSRIPVEERPVVRGGPAAYEATLPLRFLVDAMNKQHVEARTSFHAGTHACNSVMYGVLHAISGLERPPMAGFVHVSFPNEFGVIEDRLWSTATFSGIIKSSVVLVESLRDWFAARKSL